MGKRARKKKERAVTAARNAPEQSSPNQAKTLPQIIDMLREGIVIRKVLHELARQGNEGRSIATRFAIACALRVLPVWKAEHPTDNRPAVAIRLAMQSSRPEAIREASINAFMAHTQNKGTKWGMAAQAAAFAASAAFVKIGASCNKVSFAGKLAYHCVGAAALAVPDPKVERDQQRRILVAMIQKDEMIQDAMDIAERFRPFRLPA